MGGHGVPLCCPGGAMPNASEPSPTGTFADVAHAYVDRHVRERRWCIDPEQPNFAPTQRSHGPVANEVGRPSSVMRFRMLHAIAASVSCALGCRARSRSPMIDLYRKKAFSTRACRWQPDAFVHWRRPTCFTCRIVRSRRLDRGLCRDMVRELALGASSAGRGGCPCRDRVCGKPERDVASPDEGALVITPIPAAILGFVLRVHSRVHPETVLVRPSQRPELSPAPPEERYLCTNAAPWRVRNAGALISARSQF